VPHGGRSPLTHTCRKPRGHAVSWITLRISCGVLRVSLGGARHRTSLLSWSRGQHDRSSPCAGLTEAHQQRSPWKWRPTAPQNWPPANLAVTVMTMLKRTGTTRVPRANARAANHRRSRWWPVCDGRAGDTESEKRKRRQDRHRLLERRRRERTQQLLLDIQVPPSADAARRG
jgi:hypothetical protein